jgi:hypothetical protein
MVSPKVWKPLDYSLRIWSQSVSIVCNSPVLQANHECPSIMYWFKRRSRILDLFFFPRLSPLFLISLFFSSFPRAKASLNCQSRLRRLLLWPQLVVISPYHILLGSHQSQGSESGRSTATRYGCCTIDEANRGVVVEAWKRIAPSWEAIC